jgi:transposase InsO family protein
MNERVKFIAARLADDEPFSETCERFRVSRKTGYKWMERFESGGVEALIDRSRAPHSHPHAVSAEAAAELIALRRRKSHWGPRKLIAGVRRARPDLHLPVASTVAEILRREGLVRRKRRRTRRCSPYGDSLREYKAPNSVWCADFKGDFAVGPSRCYPLTITDGYSRFLLRCTGLLSTHTEPARRVFESAFREYGLPEAIRTDNGPPFSSLAPGGLSRLAAWWIRLGIVPERIEPGCPQQNGRHERMHGTLKAEVCSPPKKSFGSQQRAFDSFRREYNDERPHEALGLEPPATKYVSSPRPFPRRVPELEYPSHFRVERAYANGVITFRSVQWFLSSALACQPIGLDQVDDDRWAVHFGPIYLGIIDLRTASPRGARGFGMLIRADGVIEDPHARPRNTW